MKFGLLPYDEPDFNYILIKITKDLVEEKENYIDSIYEATRYAWKLDSKKCNYVFS